MTDIKLMTSGEEPPGYKGIVTGIGSGSHQAALNEALRSLLNAAKELGADEIRDIQVSTGASKIGSYSHSVYITLMGTAVNTEEALADDGRTMDIFEQ